MTINQDPVQTQDSQKQVEKDHNFALINKKLKYESEFFIFTPSLSIIDVLGKQHRSKNNFFIFNFLII